VIEIKRTIKHEADGTKGLSRRVMDGAGVEERKLGVPGDRALQPSGLPRCRGDSLPRGERVAML